MNRPAQSVVTAALQQAAAALAQPGQPEVIYRALDQALGTAIGHKLFTLAVYHAADDSAERV
jgi:hypothetical protein